MHKNPASRRDATNVKNLKGGVFAPPFKFRGEE
jgi:hypothetical protein